MGKMETCPLIPMARERVWGGMEWPVDASSFGRVALSRVIAGQPSART